MQNLIELCTVQSPSHDDGDMREYLYEVLSKIEGVDFFDDGDNIYATKGSGPRVCMVGHMDTVHKRVKGGITVMNLAGKLFAMDAERMEQVGVGGDDRVGIHVALEMLRDKTNIKAFFPRDEEIGCVGSSKVEKSFFDDVTMVLQCDRRGNTDFVTNASGVELSSKAFQDDVSVILAQYGYKFSTGMMTDVMELKEQGINVSMANMSCGYYNPHSDNEYIDVADVHRVTLMCSDIIDLMGDTAYPHEAPARKSYYDREFNWWDDQPSGTSFYDRMRDQALSPKQSEHSYPTYCLDCYQQPAGENVHGLCEDCLAWYHEMNEIKEINKAKRAVPKQVIQSINKLQAKPDYGQTRIIRPIDLVDKRIASGVVHTHGKKKHKKKGW